MFGIIGRFRGIDGTLCILKENNGWDIIKNVNSANYIGE